MGFLYFSGEKLKQKTNAKIILAGDKISVYIPDVPCKIIHNHKAEKNNPPFKGIATRRIGVQFKNLDSEIKGKLAEILGSAAVLAFV